VATSPATIDRRLAGDRAKMTLRGRTHTEPGSLLKTQIQIRAWVDWDEAVLGFVEIDLYGHEGGNALDEIAKIMPFRSSAWTATTAASSSTTTCSTGAASGRSPSPARGPATPGPSRTSLMNAHSAAPHPRPLQRRAPFVEVGSVWSPNHQP